MDRFEKNEELFLTIREIFEDKIPFNRVLGLKVESLNYDIAKVRFEIRDELIGNYTRGTLHGGVISSVIDVTGGLSAFIGVQKKMSGETTEKKLERFKKLGTIDLRVDYLRPGLGKWFVSSGYVLRTGNKVAVTRIELNNDKDDLIAVGTGSYVVA